MLCPFVCSSFGSSSSSGVDNPQIDIKSINIVDIQYLFKACYNESANIELIPKASK